MTTSSGGSLTIRRASRGEVGLFREWAAAEGWKPGFHDAECYHDTDPNGFFLGELEGKPISIISCVAYDAHYGFLGHYVTRPEYRGRGYGIQVWRAGLSYLGDRIVGLDGVVAQQDNYRKSGFVPAYNNVRHQVRGGGEASPNAIPASQVSFDELEAYDRGRFPAARPVFLRGWLAIPGSTALTRLRGGKVVGYGMLRPVADGFRIGPLFADDPAVAEELFQSLLAAAPGHNVFIDCPEASIHPRAAEMVQRRGSIELFPTARMYLKAAPNLPMEQIYGVTSLELG